MHYAYIIALDNFGLREKRDATIRVMFIVLDKIERSDIPMMAEFDTARWFLNNVLSLTPKDYNEFVRIRNFAETQTNYEDVDLSYLFFACIGSMMEIPTTEWRLKDILDYMAFITNDLQSKDMNDESGKAMIGVMLWDALNGVSP